MTEAETTRILVADDDGDVLHALRLLLKGEGYEVETATSPAGVMALVESTDFDAALLDLNYARDTTSGREGIELVARLRALDSTLPVIVMTAWGSVEGAVAAVRSGARDYIEKPWNNGRLLATLQSQLELSRALRRGRRLEMENRLLRHDGAPRMIAEAPVMRPVLELVARVGPSDANVLVTGEHGTGKELVARILHASSARAPRAMVTVNAGGLSEGVFESELFGHERGAFTGARTERVGRFELADGGTLFLDEIANVPIAQQAKLLRVLQTGEYERVGSSRTRRVSVRLVSATNADLHAEVAGGRFREDLLFRINTVEIRLPPLRDRREDVELLAQHFLATLNKEHDTAKEFTRPAVNRLKSHNWPGNVRELKNLVHRAFILADEHIGLDALPLGVQETPGSNLNVKVGTSLGEAERRLILATLEECDGDKKKAAEILGISLKTLYNRLNEYKTA